jgi:hypothetical protein
MTKQEKKELNNLRKIGESMNVNKKTIKIWEKNLKQGYRFFQPHNAYKPLPRTLREAFDHKIYQEIKNEEVYFKETTKAYIVGFVILLLVIGISFAQADGPWESSPYNWENNSLNWDNSSLNWDNNSLNWDNNSNNWDSNRIIRNPDGNATGYAVPKADGGINYFNLDGVREGYLYE